MKIALYALGSLFYLSSVADAALQCPDADLIQNTISTFAVSGGEGSKEGTVTFDGRTWHFYSTLKTAIVSEVKSLHGIVSDIDEASCNYLIYPEDTEIEDGSIVLKAQS